MELGTRSHVVNRLEKAIKKCRNLITNIDVITEIEDLTTQYYPM